MSDPKIKKIDEEVVVVDNFALTDTIYHLKLKAPHSSHVIKPGQFVHLSIDNKATCKLRRPFSIFDVDEKNGTIDIIYEIKGFGTHLISDMKVGNVTSIITPLGNGWGGYENSSKFLLVGGGLGAAPLHLLAKKMSEIVKKDSGYIDFIYGAKTKNLLVLKDSFDNIENVNVHICTDDGTCGEHAFCNVLVEKLLNEKKYDYMAICGPKIVMQSGYLLSKEHNLNAQVSCEEKMACGVGACKTCIVETVQGRKKACCDGPVFNGEDILW